MDRPKVSNGKNRNGEARRRTRVVQLAQIPRAFAARRSVATITVEQRIGKVQFDTSVTHTNIANVSPQTRIPGQRRFLAGRQILG